MVTNKANAPEQPYKIKIGQVPADKDPTSDNPHIEVHKLFPLLGHLERGEAQGASRFTETGFQFGWGVHHRLAGVPAGQ